MTTEKKSVEPKCEECGGIGRIKFDTQGEGYFWLCGMNDQEHSNDRYSGVIVGIKSQQKIDALNAQLKAQVELTAEFDDRIGELQSKPTEANQRIEEFERKEKYNQDAIEYLRSKGMEIITHSDATHKIKTLLNRIENLRKALSHAVSIIKAVRAIRETEKTGQEVFPEDVTTVWDELLAQDDKDSESEQPKAKWDITKHIHGKVYDLTQENMNAMIADIEGMKNGA